MDYPGVMTTPFIGYLEPTGGLCPQAGEVITSVRDMIPDPVYDDATGDPLPDTDGSFLRVQSLYRWLSSGIRELTRRCNWTVLDWTAMAQTTRQSVYSLDRRWINVDGCFCNAYRLMHLDELHTIYPSYAVAQPMWFSWHHRSDHLELALWPAPDRQDSVTTLSTDISPTAGVIPVADTTGFLPVGYVRIDGELIPYALLGSEAAQTIMPPALLPAWTGTAAAPDKVSIGTPSEPQPPGGSLQVLRRGTGGTSAVVHYMGARVEHMGIWCRGIRSPSPVRVSTDCIELPIGFIAPLESYVLAKVREAEQDRQGAQSLMQEFLGLTNEILADPQWQQPPFPMQARAYGSSPVGELAWGRVVVP